MATLDPTVEKDMNGQGVAQSDHAHATGINSGSAAQRRQHDYGSNPLAHVATNDPELRHQAFGGQFQPGLYRAPTTKIANPAPLGLSAFALTTFILSLINLQTRGVAAPNIIIASAFGYGGLVQLLAGMWEMAIGNTFGATALSSYGGFWISVGITLTPGGFNIISSLGGGTSSTFNDSFGFFLMGWFIFNTILLACTLRSTVMFFLLFFWLELALLMLGIGHLTHKNGVANVPCIKAGGLFGLLAAFWAWYNAWAGIADSSNSFFVVPVMHFPWSDKGREQRQKVDNSSMRNEQVV